MNVFRLWNTLDLELGTDVSAALMGENAQAAEHREDCVIRRAVTARGLTFLELVEKGNA